MAYKTYKSWLVNTGYKAYAIPFSIGIVISYAVFKNVIPHIEENPLFINIMIFTAILAYDIGIVYHSFETFKRQKNEP